MSGWIKNHRSILDHWLWSDRPFSKGQAWLDLIMFANFEPREVMINGHVYKLERGQQARSEVTLSKHWGWSRNKTRRFLSRLKTEHMVEQRTDRNTSVITILNYDKYQSKALLNDTTDGTTVDTRTEQRSEQRRNNVGTQYKKERRKEGKKEEYNVAQEVSDGSTCENDAGDNPGAGPAARSDSDDAPLFRGNRVAVGDLGGLTCEKVAGGPTAENQEAPACQEEEGETTVEAEARGSISGVEIKKGASSVQGKVKSSSGGAKTGQKEPRGNSEVIELVIAYLNETSGKNFSPETKETVKLISGRLKQGRKEGDFIRVIDLKVKQWGEDAKMSRFIRPSTLFNEKNMEAYLNETPPRQTEVEQERVRINTAGRGLVECKNCQAHKNGGCQMEDLTRPIDCTQFY